MLASHHQYHRGKERTHQWDTPPATLDPRLYIVSFPRADRYIGFSVEGYEGQATRRTNLWIKFLHRHIHDTIVIFEEGNRPHPLCLACDMFIPWAALKCHHPFFDLCAQGFDSQIWRMVEEEAWAGSAMEICDYVRPLETVSSFKYLGRLLTAAGNDFPDVISNIWKVRKRWY